MVFRDKIKSHIRNKSQRSEEIGNKLRFIVGSNIRIEYYV